MIENVVKVMLISGDNLECFVFRMNIWEEYILEFMVDSKNFFFMIMLRMLYWMLYIF